MKKPTPQEKYTHNMNLFDDFVKSVKRNMENHTVTYNAAEDGLKKEVIEKERWD